MIKKIIVFVIVPVALLCVLFLVFRRNTAPDPAEKRTRLSLGRLESAITATGTVKPRNRLEVKPPISGRIEQILVQEGAVVKTGDVLAFMSSTDRAALLDAAYLQGEDSRRKWEDAYKPIPLLAPIDGDVIVKAVNPGQVVTAADAVVVLSDRLIVQAQVDETDIGRVQTGQRASITLDAYPETVVRATVEHVYYESKVVSNVTVYYVDLIPDEIPQVFRSGMSADVRIISDLRENVLLVPSEYIDRQDGSSFVTVFRAGETKPQKQEILTGISDEENTEVLGGLEAGDVVIRKSLSLASRKVKGTSSPFVPSRPRAAR
jgi:macrolide-specific efflux system membrane fusion protein